MGPISEKVYYKHRNVVLQTSCPLRETYPRPYNESPCSERFSGEWKKGNILQEGGGNKQCFNKINTGDKHPEEWS